MRSPSNEPKLKGDVGSTASIATLFPRLAKSAVMALTNVLLPAPGGPVIPMMGVEDFASMARSNGSAGGRLFSTMVSARAIVIKLPCLIPVRSESVVSIVQLCCKKYKCRHIDQ